MRKIITLLLTLVMVASIYVPAFANTSLETPTNEGAEIVSLLTEFAKGKEIIKKTTDSAKKTLSELAVSSATNIVLNDCFGNALGEFHADGYAVEFVYEDELPELRTMNSSGNKRKLAYIKDSNGVIQKFSFDKNGDIARSTVLINGEKVLEKYYNTTEEEKPTEMMVQPAASTFYVYHSDGTKTDVSTLIEDDEFELCTSCASIKEIQQLFEDKNSPLQYTIDNYIYDGTEVYKSGTCQPAQYIHDICIRMELSPKLILATLQKESSLVSSRHTDLETPYNSKTFYFCMGNGSSTSSRSTGFENQIYGGASTLRSWYARGLKYSYPYTYTHRDFKGYHGSGYSGYETSITITNAATFSLYKYTPYTCTGNDDTRTANVMFKSIFNTTLADLPS